MLREGLKDAGIPLNIGSKGGSALDWAAHFVQYPGTQRKAFDQVLKASRVIDAKYGTTLVQDFWRNVIEGKFTPYP